ncbi:hypothetical protein QJS10_CPB12g00754 [Acorus calamus]|uniref:Reverse transcriptase zinc-binding domain-containing protein n=1 Tax=Acorus calamus TaxID=4465 RepID=A0AAV9DJR4_ACOCL|nr:hypothetical protein QJS10_CPB12g00754 [Acorus calamus]
MNKALLSKWLWRWINEPESQWVHIFRDRYGAHGANARRWPTIGARASSLCKGIFSNCEEFTQTVHWEIGNGMTTRFWTDVWCGDAPFCILYPLVYALTRAPQETVSNSWTVEGNGGSWSVALRRNIFAPEEATQLEALADKLGEWNGRFGLERDMPRWSPKPTEGFSVKSYYTWQRRHLTQISLACGNPNNIWKPKIPRKIKAQELWGMAGDATSLASFHDLAGMWAADVVLGAQLEAGTRRRVAHLIVPVCTWTIWLTRKDVIFKGARVYTENMWAMASMLVRDWVRGLAGTMGVILGGGEIRLIT